MFAPLLYRMRAYAVAALFALSAVAYAQTGNQGQKPEEPKTPDVTEGAKPLPMVQPGVAAPVDPKSYQIGAGDVINVKVWKEPDVSGPYQVRPDGKITLPLIGEIQAGNLTPMQLTEQLTKAFGEYINKPEVTVSIQAVLSKKYYITGEVNRPGAYALVVPITVMEALSNSGGFREFANKKKIVIMRGTQRIRFNYNDVVKGKNLDTNIYLQDGDQIYVPD
ncbi:MAG TPA: polysaccharide biosynthesis/export family protein [Bryobacteraceae bacterium]|nr:polysaccharide biosynthesis/export family protein [Bryobacteraceae bacterium]